MISYLRSGVQVFLSTPSSFWSITSFFYMSEHNSSVPHLFSKWSKRYIASYVLRVKNYILPGLHNWERLITRSPTTLLNISGVVARDNSVLNSCPWSSLWRWFEFTIFVKSTHKCLLELLLSRTTITSIRNELQNAITVKCHLAFPALKVWAYLAFLRCRLC